MVIDNSKFCQTANLFKTALRSNHVAHGHESTCCDRLQKVNGVTLIPFQVFPLIGLQGDVLCRCKRDVHKEEVDLVLEVSDSDVRWIAVSVVESIINTPLRKQCL